MIAPIFSHAVGRVVACPLSPGPAAALEGRGCRAAHAMVPPRDSSACHSLAPSKPCIFVSPFYSETSRASSYALRLHAAARSRFHEDRARRLICDALKSHSSTRSLFCGSTRNAMMTALDGRVSSFAVGCSAASIALLCRVPLGMYSATSTYKSATRVGSARDRNTRMWPCHTDESTFEWGLRASCVYVGSLSSIRSSTHLSCSRARIRSRRALRSRRV